MSEADTTLDESQKASINQVQDHAATIVGLLANARGDVAVMSCVQAATSIIQRLQKVDAQTACDALIAAIADLKRGFK